MRYTFIASALVALVAAIPSSLVTNSPCDCGEPPICILSFPEGCYCQNDYLRKCYEKCGGVPPIYADCSVDPDVKRSDPSLVTYNRCEIGSGACADGFACVGADGQDEPGYCMPDTPCGGFPGTPCADEQICVDDERDDCDPENGGSDCIGICFTPQMS